MSEMNSDNWFTKPMKKRRSVRFAGLGKSRMAVTRFTSAEIPSADRWYLQKLTLFGNHELVLVQGDAMLVAAREHLVNTLEMGGKVVIIEEDVIHHFDTVVHPLECHISTKAVGVASGRESHGPHAMDEAAIRGDKYRKVAVFLV